MNSYSIYEPIGLLNLINETNKEVKIICNDGEICINAQTFDFTYIGKFGSNVLNAMTKLNPTNNIANKLTLLAKFTDLYSKNNGGFNIQQIN